jgi:MFS family permease
MNVAPPATQQPTNVRYGVLGFACVLSMITYLDRVCFGTVAPDIQREFGLSETQKGLLFSAFALAYAAFEVPTGWLGDVYGAKKTLIRIVLAWSLFTVLTGLIYPAVMGATLAFLAMLAVRFLFGVGEAGAYPNIARAFHNWFPFEERASAKGAVWMAGRFMGGLSPFLVLMLVYETGPADAKVVHWRHIFWVFGAIGVVWCLLFAWWYRERPELNPNVNQAELALIQRGEEHGAATSIPWRRIFTNANLWVLCAMYFCAAYGWYFNITYLPGYLRDYFPDDFGPATREKWTSEWWTFSLMAGAPLLLGSIACLAGGVLSDFFIKKTGNRKWGRRLFGVIGHGVASCCFFLAVFADSALSFILALAFAAFWNDVTMGAAWASCIDIGRKFSGIVAGCMNTVGNLGGVAAGFLSGYIIDLHRAGLPADAPREAVLQASRPGWTINFLVFGAVYVLATFLWLAFDSTKPIVPDQKSTAPAE